MHIAAVMTFYFIWLGISNISIANALWSMMSLYFMSDESLNRLSFDCSLLRYLFWLSREQKKIPATRLYLHDYYIIIATSSYAYNKGTPLIEDKRIYIYRRYAHGDANARFRRMLPHIISHSVTDATPTLLH